MDLPDGPLGDIDLGWYVGAARARILANRDFPHLDPKWLADSPLAQGLHARGLAPSPHWSGKKSPRGARKDQPSYFWDWSRCATFGTHTGPPFGILVLDVNEPDKFGKWLGQSLLEDRGLSDCLVSYHRQDSAEAVRSGAAKGKLIFRFAADDTHSLARVGKAALRQSLGLEIFFGHGDPSILGEHPSGAEHDYLLSDNPLGPPPDWLITEITERAAKKAKAPRPKGPGGNGKPADPAAIARYAQEALESEVEKVAAAPEGERNNGLFKAACRIGGLVGAGALEREVAEEALAAATTLPAAEASATIRNGLERGMACPRDLARVGRNGDGAGT